MPETRLSPRDWSCLSGARRILYQLQDLTGLSEVAAGRSQGLLLIQGTGRQGATASKNFTEPLTPEHLTGLRGLPGPRWTVGTVAILAVYDPACGMRPGTPSGTRPEAAGVQGRGRASAGATAEGTPRR
jgi:hypothetical protein